MSLFDCGGRGTSFQVAKPTTSFPTAEVCLTPFPLMAGQPVPYVQWLDSYGADPLFAPRPQMHCRLGLWGTELGFTDTKNFQFFNLSYKKKKEKEKVTPVDLSSEYEQSYQQTSLTLWIRTLLYFVVCGMQNVQLEDFGNLPTSPASLSPITHRGVQKLRVWNGALWRVMGGCWWNEGGPFWSRLGTRLDSLLS